MDKGKNIIGHASDIYKAYTDSPTNLPGIGPSIGAFNAIKTLGDKLGFEPNPPKKITRPSNKPLPGDKK